MVFSLENFALVFHFPLSVTIFNALIEEFLNAQMQKSKSVKEVIESMTSNKIK